MRWISFGMKQKQRKEMYINSNTRGDIMRLDKFLKVSRIIKRRPVAKEVIDSKKVKVNGKPAKAGTEIKVGDILEVEYFTKLIKAEVVEVPTGNVGKDQAKDLVKIIDVKDIKIEREEII